MNIDNCYKGSKLTYIQINYHPCFDGDAYAISENQNLTFS